MDHVHVTVGDLRRDELELLGWSGSPTHLRNVAGQLDRCAAGQVEYSSPATPTGRVAKGAVDDEEFAGAGSIMPMATRPDLQSRGLAARLTTVVDLARRS